MAGEEKRWGGPLLLLRHHCVLDVLRENSLLFVSLLCGLGDLSTRGGFLLDRLDDTNGHGLPHVTHSKASWEDEIAKRKDKQEKKKNPETIYSGE